jgi:hypothetical protein
MQKNALVAKNYFKITEIGIKNRYKERKKIYFIFLIEKIKLC